jgi:succinate-semialdehyde dehydrogenase/glutarate-semialdehyde dehydrogenase
MALLAGNSVVLKTASETQMVGRKLEECFLAARLPEGIFNYVNLPGKVAGEPYWRREWIKYSSRLGGGRQISDE